MKKLIYIFIFLLIISCKEEVSKSNLDLEVMESYEMEWIENEKIIGNNNFNFSLIETFELQELVSQKLQEFYDLSTLKNNHPEFKKTIELQLRNFTNDVSLLSSIKQTVLIKDIKLVNKQNKNLDSIQKLKLRYNYTINNSVKIDSIYAEITSKKIVLDGNHIISNKIKFTKE